METIDKILRPEKLAAISDDRSKQIRVWLAYHGQTARGLLRELGIKDECAAAKIDTPHQRRGAVEKLAEVVGFDAEECLAAGRNGR